MLPGRRSPAAILVQILFCLGLSLFPGAAAAHPYGDTYYGHLVHLRLDSQQVTVDYAAEVPTPVLIKELRAWMAKLDSPTPADHLAFQEAWREELLGGLRLKIDGESVDWTVLPQGEPPASDARFVVFRLQLAAPLPEGARTLQLFNGNHPDEPTFFLNQLEVSDGIVVDAASLLDVEEGVVRADRSGQWRMEESNRELRVSFRVRSDLGAALAGSFRQIGAAPGSEEATWHGAASAMPTVERDPLQAIVTGQLTPGIVLFGLGLAIVLGAAHGLAPGHGKTLVAAYLLGPRQTVRHAVWLGIIVTITHTFGVFILGALAWLLEERFPPEVILPWMELASGLLVLGVGVGLAKIRWKAWKAWKGHKRMVIRRPEPHDHHHDHDHHHHHDHHHDHSAMDEDAHAKMHASEIAEGAESWRGLVALGISGGLVPCPSALVLLLTAVSLGRTALGLVLVTAFSFGLALLVTAVGTVVVLFGDRIRSLQGGQGLTQALPVFSAFVVTALGLGLTWNGVAAVLGGT